MVITENYKKAFSEVNIILKSVPEQLSSKIPNDLIKIIDEEKFDSYNPDLHQLIVDKNIMQESIALLGLIYRDFLSPEELRQTLKIQDDIEFKEFQLLENITEVNDIYKKNKTENLYSEIKETALIKPKEKWYKRIINFFKRK